MPGRLALGVCALAALAVAGAARAAPSPPQPATAPSSSWIDFNSPDFWHGDVAAQFPWPLHLVAKGDHVRGLPIADHQINPTFTWQGRTWTVDDYMRAYKVSGVMVLKDGQVVLERYGLGRQPTDRWVSQSVAKSVTSLLFGAAIQDGKIRLEDPIVRFIPELKGSAYDGVSVRQLLMMSSGVKWNEDYSDQKSDLAKFYQHAQAGEDALLGYMKALPRAHPPGSTFHYNTAETHLAGLIVSRAVGMPLAQYLSEKIWKPYGMERDAYWMTDNKGREMAGCCLSITLADYARLGQFTLDGGVIDGKRVVPSWWIPQSTKVQISNGQPAPSGYGYFWWIGPKAFEASGIFGQSILIYPKEHLVVVLNSAWPRPVGDDLFAAMHRFDGAIHDAAAPEAAKDLAP